MKNIIGDQPTIFESFGPEAKHRFNYVFVKFITAIASINSPFTIVLEDLHWADLASIELITALVKSSIKNLMLIGVYRDNEVQDNRGLVNFLHEVKTMNLSITEITLNNMDNESLNSFVSDTLRISPLVSYPLTAFLWKKTGGNPFFVKQMVTYLLDQNLITFVLEENKWQWNNSILNDDLTVNIIDLLKSKILSFSDQAQHAMKISSVLQSPISISTLALIIDGDEGVDEALASGILTYQGCNKCRFIHDQFRYAASCLLPENRKQLYLNIAEKLLRICSTVDLEDNIVDITNLYNDAKDLIKDDKRFEVAKLFLSAGEKAMASTASAQAFKNFESGIEIIGSNGWENYYNFLSQYILQCSEICILQY